MSFASINIIQGNMNMTVNERINALRSEMKKASVDIILIPTSDYHDSEYVGKYFTEREFISGFSGSAGTVAVSLVSSYLWTDGRYFLQAANELKGSEIILNRMGEEGVPTISQYLKSSLKPGMTLGFDGRVFSTAAGEGFKQIADDAGAYIRDDIDLIDNIWKDRPKLSSEPVFVLSDAFTGRPVSDKLSSIRDIMAEKGCDAHIITSLDDIAWILNMRGNDVECNPVFLSYLYIAKDSGILFINPSAPGKDALEILKNNNIEIRPYNDIYEYVKGFERSYRVMIDPAKVNYKLSRLISEHCVTVNADNPSTLMKSIKNSVERENLKKYNRLDGAAMVKFLCWLDENIGKENISEVSVSDRLEAFRAENPDFCGVSFPTIAGYNAHGAIIHYEPTAETDMPLKPEGLLLVDSGAQYLGGTTDITRTIALGPLTDEMKHHYTMVLKGNLRLSAVKFPKGCSGANLDIIARQPFWNEVCDYNHGTGHGVGYFLNVHEGPQNLNYKSARVGNRVPFEDGMVTTDEPGIYIEGKYGIRIENDLLCVYDTKNEYGQFMRFDVLTLCPIDLRPVNTDELTDDEKQILNSYHSLVKEQLMPLLPEKEKKWLENAARMI